MPDRLTVASINLQNYAHNLSKILEQLEEGVQVMAIVKANAYGHGIEMISKTAVSAGASYLGIVSLGELKRIRNAGIETPVLILNYLDQDSVEEAIRLDTALTVMDMESAKIIQAVASAQSKTVNIHLKIDTGMHRAGCDPSVLLELVQEISNSPNLNLEGLFTHFAESEAVDASFTQQQLATFNQCLDLLRANNINPKLVHCANSAAIVAFPEAHFTMVRTGIISYGLNPFGADHPKYALVQETFRQALSLKTQVAFIRTIEPGETVGYNRRWKAERTSTLALLPIGYGDGWRRAPHNAGRVMISGQYAPIVGSVAMDQTVVDITDIDGVLVGDEVVLLGTQGQLSITADDIAKAYGTINYEVVTALSDRITRNYEES